MMNIDSKWIQFHQIDSTNQYMKDHFQEMPHFSIVSANHQTQGRGRMEHIWLDEGKSALFSILLKENLPNDKVGLVPLYAAYVLYEVLSTFTPNIEIKWPNDLLVKGKKISGILSESIFQHNQVLALIIGIGINVNDNDFDQSFKNQTTSLFIETKKTVDIHLLIHTYMKTFIMKYDEFVNGTLPMIPKLNRIHRLNGEQIMYQQSGETEYAKVLRISEDGALKVTRNGREYSLYSGEVHHVRKK